MSLAIIFLAGVFLIAVAGIINGFSSKFNNGSEVPGVIGIALILVGIIGAAIQAYVNR